MINQYVDQNISVTILIIVYFEKLEHCTDRFDWYASACSVLPNWCNNL